MSAEESAKRLVRAYRRGRLSEEAVRLLVEAHGSGRPAQVGGVTLKSDREAYRVQDAVFSRLWPGARAAAWKAGGPSDKVEPTAAPIPPERLLASPASIAAKRLNLLGVEAEIAFRLRRDLPPRARPYSEQTLADAIGEVLVAIEVCATRLADWKESSSPWKLADFQNNGALVAGSGIADWRSIDFGELEARFSIGGAVRKAKGAHPFGNPFRLIPWLSRHCAKRGLGLHAGDVVTTGAWTGLETVRPGDEVIARFADIGEAKVRII